MTRAWVRPLLLLACSLWCASTYAQNKTVRASAQVRGEQMQLTLPPMSVVVVSRSQ